MSREIIEDVTFSTEDRPIKGYAVDQTWYFAETKQSVLDEQAISNERVAGMIAYAKDTKKLMFFSDDGSSFTEHDFDLSKFALTDVYNTFTNENDFNGDVTYNGATHWMFKNAVTRYGGPSQPYVGYVYARNDNQFEIGTYSDVNFVFKLKDSTNTTFEAISQDRSADVINLGGRWDYLGESEKPTSLINRGQVEEIVSESFDNLLEPKPSLGTFMKHPNINPEGYVNSYAGVTYDSNDRLIAPRNPASKTLFEIFFEANSTTAYCTIAAETVAEMVGEDLANSQAELGIVIADTTRVKPGLYSSTKPTNVPSGWAWNGKFFPLTTSGGQVNDPNDPSEWLDNGGNYVNDVNSAGQSSPSYPTLNFFDLSSKNGQTWRFALRRGYIKKDGSFEFNASSNYFVFVVRISGGEATATKMFPVFVLSGGLEIYPDAISAYLSKQSISGAEIQAAINNQATIDLMCKSRYGNDCEYIETLTTEAAQ